MLKAKQVFIEPDLHLKPFKISIMRHEKQTWQSADICSLDKGQQ